MSLCPMGAFPYTIHPGDTLWLIAKRFNTTINEIAAINSGIDINNLYAGQVICVMPRYGYYSPSNYPTSAKISKSAADLNNQLRMLWEQHVFWTRLTILSMVFDFPDVDLVTQRLLRNPKDFETLLRPLYGDAIASKFSTDHLVIASQLVKAAKAGNSAAAQDAEKRWYANADEIATFLAEVNPYWSFEQWRSMLHEHLALTKNEAVDMLEQNYSDGISTFDKIEQQALTMADVMTSGIVRQFANKFI